MATKRIKDISTTATTFAADDFIALDASSVGTRKMAKASLITQVGANYLEKADNLSDVADKDTSKLNLEVPNVGTAANEVPVNGMLGDLAFQSSAGVVVDDLTVDGQLTAAVGKPMPVNGPSMRFDGSNDYVEFADNDAFSFTNGTDDTPFSVSAWVKLEDATSGTIISKFGSSASDREYRLYIDGSDLLTLDIRNTSGDSTRVYATTAMTGYENQWIHIAATYAGSGPNSATAFASAADVMSLHINGKSVALTKTNNASYSGMSNTSEAVVIGRRIGANYLKGEIRDVKLFNKELSAAEVREVYSNGQLPESFAESTGRSLGAIDETSGLASWSGAGSIVPANLTETANTTVGGRANVLKEEATASGGGVTTRFYIASAFDMGKRVRVEFDYYLPSSNATIDKLEVFFTSGSTLAGLTVTDTWTRASIEAVVGPTSTLQFAFYDGGSFNPTAGDFIALDNFAITQIGSVLDARAEQFDTSTGKLHDLSGNEFVGTQSGGVSLLGREFPVYETGTWTPSVTFGGGSTGIAYSYQEGVYTRTGDVVHCSCIFQLTNKGTDTGDAVISGLPFVAKSAASDIFVANFGRCANLSGLTSCVEGAILNGTSTIRLNDVGSTGSSNLQNTNFTNTSILRFSATYQIQ